MDHYICLMHTQSKKGNGERAKKYMVKCAQCKGEVWLHTHRDGVCSRKIFTLPQFVGKSCFEIFHSDKAKGLWNYSMKNGKRIKVYQQVILFIKVFV